MAMTRCEANLHFYDTEKHKACPYCEGRIGTFRPVEIPRDERESGNTCTAPTITLGPQKLKAVAEQPSPDERPAAPHSAPMELDATEQSDQDLVQTVLAIRPPTPPVQEEAPPQPSPYQQFVVEDGAAASSEEFDQKTVILQPEANSIRPVVGWLVTVAGPQKGKDYRIFSGINEIARDEDPEVDIVITGDGMISRRHHADIQYDPEDNVFYLIKLKNEAVKINDVTIKRPTPLKPYDVVQLGETRLVFVPLCSEKFQWAGQ